MVTFLRKIANQLIHPMLRIQSPALDSKLDHVAERILGRKFDFDAFVDNNPAIRTLNLNPRLYVGFEFLKSLAAFRPISGKLFRQLGTAAIRDPMKSTVLVVTHQASLTGAPIVALEIAKELRKSHTVLVISLGTGPLEDAFRENSDLFLCIPNFHLPLHRNTIRRFSRSFRIEIAIFNSIETRGLLELMSEMRGAKILNVHEFLTQAKPIPSVIRALEAADKIIFSSVILSKQLDSIPLGTEVRPRVLSRLRIVPQPPPEYKLAGTQPFPKGLQAGQFVLGAGTVEYRKGVDLFVALARKFDSFDKSLSFYWVGSGYSPDVDPYCSLLKEQVSQAALGSNLRIVESLPREDFGILLSHCKALVLTSRLDPLPNVALEALKLGKPVFFFEGATGLKEVLNERDIDALCADQFDIAHMANLISKSKGIGWPKVLLNSKVSNDYADYLREILD